MPLSEATDRILTIDAQNGAAQFKGSTALWAATTRTMFSRTSVNAPVKIVAVAALSQQARPSPDEL